MGQCSSTMGGNNQPEPKAPEPKAIDVSLLPRSSQALITSYLGNGQLAECSNRNTIFHSLLQPELTLRSLMHHVARGEHDKDIPQIEAILTAHPELLLEKSHTIDLSGRSFTGLSPWQLAWCAGDDDMVKRMKAYTRSSNLDQQLMADQLHELFPRGYEAHLAQQADKKSIFNFDAIVEAINGANDAQLPSAIDLKGAVLPATDASHKRTNTGVANELTKALNAFRQTFTKHSLQEKIFNPQHLFRTLEIYDDRYHHWSYMQCRVFWSQVVGFVKRFMPACYAQAFAQGLCYVTKEPNPDPLNRSFSARFGSGQIFSRRRVGDFLGLGFKFDEHLSPWLEGPYEATSCASHLKKLCQTKTTYFADLCLNPCSRSSRHLALSKTGG